MHGQLVETHSLLMTTFAESQKRPRSDDWGSTSASEFSDTSSLQAREADPPACVCSKFPEVKYWTKQDWKEVENKRKNSSEVAGPRGGGRSAKGENVMMLYVEHDNGRPVSGAMASDIRDFARSIWRGFYSRGMAPEKWGDVSKAVKDDYIHDMEREWSVLRYCEGHWKANYIATSIYSQWYHAYHKKTKRIKDDCKEPKAKKRRMTSEEPRDASSPPAEPWADTPPPPICETPLEDEDIAEVPCPQVEEQGPIQATIARPRARPLTNPL